jgi:PRTRC genetic system protein E
MFKELVPILRNRAVLMTATALDDDQIRVNVVPKKMKDGDHDALTTPLSVTGTAEELDTQLAATLVGFVASHLQMKNALEKAKADMDAATKTAQAEARAKSKTATRSVPAKTEVTQNAPSAKPAEPAKPAPQKPAASSICRRHRLPLPPPRQPNRKMTQDLQKSTMTNQSKRSKNWMTRPDGNNSSLQEGIG